MSLFASSRDGESVRIVHLVGDVDLSNAEKHGDVLCELLDGCDAATMVVNCSRLTFLESQGLTMMHRVHRHGAALGTTVVWRGLGAAQRRVLQITGLDRVLVLEGGGQPVGGHQAPGTG